ncbi:MULTISPECIES: hypothetical protein [Pseudomonas]|uniref:hypothetical protein n=1 Tax=Pseudomonas TaxID=286 RepID=UPI001F2CF546|nr:hypothetical protein [Pseudomonas faucium]
MLLSNVILPLQRYDALNVCNLLQHARRSIIVAKKADTPSEAQTDALEQQVPRWASDATYCAHVRALQIREQGVLCTDDGNLVRVSSDGEKTVVAKAKARRKVKLGEVITVRKAKESSTGEGA